MHSLVIPFDDIFKNLSLVVSYTPVMLHSQWRYHHCTRDIPITRLHLMPSHGGEGGGERVYPPPITGEYRPFLRSVIASGRKKIGAQILLDQLKI